MGKWMRRVVRHMGLTFVAAGGVLTGLSCGGADVTAPTSGSIAITTTTNGPEPDANGYAVTIDDGAETTLGTNASLQRDDLEPGSHSVRLTGMAANCTVEGQNPRSVTVSGGATADVSFAVTCTATTGSLQITTITTGPSPDADGYTVSVDGGTAQLIEINSTLTVSSLAPGTHTVALAGLVTNCAVQGDNPRSVTIVAGASAAVTFTISCPTPGVTRWTAMTSGTTNTLTGVSGSSPDNVLVVDGSSTIRHYNGTSWVPQRAPADVEAVWANSAGGAFAVGSGRFGTFLLYDGQQWSPMPSPPVPTPPGEEHNGVNILAVWGSSGTNVFAVGYWRTPERDEEHKEDPPSHGYLARYDGLSWSASSLGGDELTGVWGSSANDVWAVERSYFDSYESGILHSDGDKWSQVLFEYNLDLQHIWGSLASDVYATGPGGIWHFDGRSWSALANSPTGGLGPIWGSSATDIFTIGGRVSEQGGYHSIWHFDGVSWTSVYTSASALHAIWGSSSTDVFAVGENGTILHGTP